MEKRDNFKRDPKRIYPSTGTYTIEAIADATNRNEESDETNNELSYAIRCRPPEQPDLTITQMSPSISSPYIGETVTFTVKTKNTGELSTGTYTYIHYYIDNVNTGQDYIRSMLSGMQETTTFTWTCGSEGEHTIKVIADAVDRVSESNEGNNELTYGIYCKGNPDLVIDSIIPDKTEPVIGDTITFTTITKNTGLGSTDVSSSVYYYQGDTYIGEDYVGVLGTGFSETDSFIWTCPYSPGNYTIKAKADGGKRVSESNEGNNELTYTLYCRYAYKPFNITVNTNLGAYIYLDGRHVGDTVCMYPYQCYTPFFYGIYFTSQRDWTNSRPKWASCTRQCYPNQTTIKDVPPGTHIVTAKKQGYMDAAMDVIGPPDRTVNLNLIKKPEEIADLYAWTIDMEVDIDKIKTNLQEIGYDVRTGSTNTNKQTILNNSEQDSVFYIVSHGTSTFISQMEMSEVDCINYKLEHSGNDICISADEISSPVDKSRNKNLSGMKLAYLSGCNTGTHNPKYYNLHEAFTNAGAKSFVGFTEKIWHSPSQEFDKKFFEYASNGNTTGISCQLAATYLDDEKYDNLCENGGYNCWKIYGEESIKLN